MCPRAVGRARKVVKNWNGTTELPVYHFGSKDLQEGSLGMRLLLLLLRDSLIIQVMTAILFLSDTSNCTVAGVDADYSASIALSDCLKSAQSRL